MLEKHEFIDEILASEMTERWCTTCGNKLEGTVNYGKYDTECLGCTLEELIKEEEGDRQHIKDSRTIHTGPDEVGGTGGRIEFKDGDYVTESRIIRQRNPTSRNAFRWFGF